MVSQSLALSHSSSYTSSYVYMLRYFAVSYLIPQVRDYVKSIEEVQSTQQAPPLAFAPRTSPHRAHAAASSHAYHGYTFQRTYEAASSQHVASLRVCAGLFCTV